MVNLSLCFNLRRSNVELIINAVKALDKATTHEIIGWIKDQDIRAPPPRVVSQICSCMPIIIKVDDRSGSTVWGKREDFDKKIKQFTGKT